MSLEKAMRRREEGDFGAVTLVSPGHVPAVPGARAQTREAGAQTWINVTAPEVLERGTRGGSVDPFAQTWVSTGGPPSVAPAPVTVTRRIAPRRRHGARVRDALLAYLLFEHMLSRFGIEAGRAYSVALSVAVVGVVVLFGWGTLRARSGR